MLFSSVTFLFYFLPLVVMGYFLVPATTAKNLFLLSASLVFYYWGEPWFVLVMLASIAVNYVAGVLMAEAGARRRKAIVGSAIAANLVFLGVFKYADFLVANLNLLLAPLGWPVPLPEFSLPIGISFFTFQGISYLIDVYRRHVPAERNPLNVGLYIAMFPQLIAGPIVRFETVARQIHERRSTLARSSVGARIFIIGLAQKMLIANEVALLADSAFASAAPSMLEAWLGLAAYTLQIYFDFAGYSNMAIGLGIVFGFTFPRNFRLPYRSRSVTEFWRRWHISLSTWFRDYLYIPLGGNRHSPARTYINLATVFLLCGLWHGASWTFVVWGLHHGVLLILERAWLGRRLRTLPHWVSRGYALLAVMAGWVWFRAVDLDHALRYFRSLAGVNGALSITVDTRLVIYPTTLAALLLGAALATRSDRHHRVRRLLGRLPTRWRSHGIALADNAATGALLILSLLAVGSGSYNPFLYFRF